MIIFLKPIFYSLTIFIYLIESSFEQTETNNIVFDLADLTIDYQNDFNRVRIEAFKSINNDLIIEKKEIEKYGQLMWLSIGDPTLVLSPVPNKKNVSSLVLFNPEGFDISVEILTNNHKKMFKDVVLRKYNINIKEDQIVSLVPAKFECLIVLYSDTSKVLISGKVMQLNRMPLEISFDAPISSKERTLFEKRLMTDKDNLDIKINCEATSAGQTYRENTLIISGTQLNRLGLTDKIFGIGNEKYVTRNQVSQLSSEVYQMLNIIEVYQMPENKFKESFINDFITMTATSIYQNVNVNDTLSLLSKYNFEDDIKPNVIYSEMSKIFTINKTNNKEILTLSKTNYDRLITTYGKSTGGSAGGSFFGIKFGGSASYATSQSSYWESSNTLFTNQLNELNTYFENEVQWERKGNIIVPKSISVSKLSKALFQRDMTFSRVKREYTEAPYKRTFLLRTLNNLYTSDASLDKERRLIEVEKKLESLKIESFNNIGKIEKSFETFKNESLFRIEALKPIGIKGDDIIGRKFENGKIAKSCNEYIKPLENGYCYSGDIGSGFYWILPNPSKDSFKVYCDMETGGGGWTFYYTTDNVIHLTSFSKSNPINFTQNGYFADLREVEFTDIMFIRISDMAKDWFTQTTKIKINDFISDNILSMTAGIIYTKFLPNGGAKPGFYQLTMADNLYHINYGVNASFNIMLSGSYGNDKSCLKNYVKTPEYWCSDFSSNYYRIDSSYTNIRGVCFRENGLRDCDKKIVSVAIR